ncbi:MAG: type IV pilin, partial [Thermoplasmatales archaeon]
MEKRISFSEGHAVSQVVGALLLVLIALMTFIPIYIYIFQIPIPPAEPNAKLMACVNDQGFVVLEHMGGKALLPYEIHLDGQLAYESYNDPLEIGEKNIPELEHTLDGEDDRV